MGWQKTKSWCNDSAASSKSWLSVCRCEPGCLPPLLCLLVHPSGQLSHSGDSSGNHQHGPGAGWQTVFGTRPDKSSSPQSHYAISSSLKVPGLGRVWVRHLPGLLSLWLLISFPSIKPSATLMTQQSPVTCTARLG